MPAAKTPPSIRLKLALPEPAVPPLPARLPDDVDVKRSNFETLPRRANLDIPRPISVDAPHFTLRVCELNFNLV
jgi:hypothetical protein